MFCDYGLLIGLNLNRHWRPTRGNQKMSQSVHVRVLPFLTCPRCSSPGGKGESRWRKRLYRGRPLPPVGDPHRKNNQNNNKDTKNTQTNKSRINVYAPMYRQSMYVKHLMEAEQVHIYLKSHWSETSALSEHRWIEQSIQTSDGTQPSPHQCDITLRCVILCLNSPALGTRFGFTPAWCTHVVSIHLGPTPY